MAVSVNRMVSLSMIPLMINSLPRSHGKMLAGNIEMELDFRGVIVPTWHMYRTDQLSPP